MNKADKCSAVCTDTHIGRC